MTTTLLFSLTLGLGAPALRDKDPTQIIYGLWEMEETPDQIKQRVIERSDGPYRYRFFRDGTWQVYRGDKEVGERRGFRFEPKTGLPTIDFNTPPAPKHCSVVLGVYKIEGDSLTICCSYPDVPRPTDLKGGSLMYVHKMRRVKD